MPGRPTRVWLTLGAATLASWALAERHWAGKLTALVIMLIAAYKVRLVFLNFMELRSAPWPWRPIFESWIGISTLMICAMYWYGRI